jgi:hypothetical protein
MRAAALAATLVVGLAGALSAQTMRPFATFRQLHGETRLAARLDFAAGHLRLASGRAGELYRMSLSYDADRFVPLSHYEPSGNAVALGVEPVGGAGLRVVSRNQLQQEAVVELSPRTDLSLVLSLGAVEADLDVGGLRVADLRLKAGASRTVLRFSEPNAIACARADISAGAAEMSVLGLGNSGCERVRVEGGVGKMMLDFGGAWTRSQQVELNLAVTELRLRLPREVGVRIQMDRFLSSFEPAGLERRGKDWVSRGYDPARPHLDVALQTAMGTVRVDWDR